MSGREKGKRTSGYNFYEEEAVLTEEKGKGNKGAKCASKLKNNKSRDMAVVKLGRGAGTEAGRCFLLIVLSNDKDLHLTMYV